MANGHALQIVNVLQAESLLDASHHELRRYYSDGRAKISGTTQQKQASSTFCNLITRNAAGLVKSKGGGKLLGRGRERIYEHTMGDAPRRRSSISASQAGWRKPEWQGDLEKKVRLARRAIGAQREWEGREKLAASVFFAERAVGRRSVGLAGRLAEQRSSSSSSSSAVVHPDRLLRGGGAVGGRLPWCFWLLLVLLVLLVPLVLLDDFGAFGASGALVALVLGDA